MNRLINELEKSYNIRDIELYTGLSGSYRICLNNTQWIDLYVSTTVNVYKMVLYTENDTKAYSITRSFSDEDLQRADLQVNVVADDIKILLEEQGDKLRRPLDDFIEIQAKFEDNLDFNCDWMSSIDPSDVNNKVIQSIPGNVYSQEDDKVVYFFRAFCGSERLLLDVRLVMNFDGLFSINRLSLGRNNLQSAYYSFRSPGDVFKLLADILGNYSSSDISVRSDFLKIIFAISKATK